MPSLHARTPTMAESELGTAAFTAVVHLSKPLSLVKMECCTCV